MVIDFTAQTAPLLWAVIGTLVILALVIFTCVDPELAEVYFGEAPLLVATLALAAIAIAVLASSRPDVSRQLGAFVPGR
jgi:hypothetical protein